MGRNKKVFVYMVLFLVLIAQVAFSGTLASEKGAGTSVMAQAAVSDMDVVTQDNSINNLQSVDIASTTSNYNGEDVQVERNIVYRNTLTSDGVIVDNLTVNKQMSDFQDKVLMFCEDRINVYEQPDMASPVVGCMYTGCQADILEKGGMWTKISSGNVVGYVKNTFMLFGEEADKVAPFIGKRVTTVVVDELNVYAAADVGSAVIATFYNGDTIRVYEEVGEWHLAECDSGYGYVPSNGIRSSYDLPFAWTIEEEQAYFAEKARLEAERIEAERAAAARLAQAQSMSMGRTTNPAMEVSDAEVYLLACIIEWEAGWEPYEGKLAVANVVLNRVRSPRFKPTNITDVIYSPGQFTGVLDGNGNISDRFATLLANGPVHDDCYTAAGEALAGINNIGDYLFFISVKKANYARYIQYTIINNHCFYAY